MHIDLIRSSSKSLPQQISDTLAQRITSGLLQPGTRLPSVRGLASSLKVSQVTVSKAYAELESHGHILCSQGKGCFVAARPHNEQDSGSAWQDGYDDFLPRAQLWRNFDYSAVQYPFILQPFIASFCRCSLSGLRCPRW